MKMRQTISIFKFDELTKKMLIDSSKMNSNDRLEAFV